MMHSHAHERWVSRALTHDIADRSTWHCYVSVHHILMLCCVVVGRLTSRSCTCTLYQIALHERTHAHTYTLSHLGSHGADPHPLALPLHALVHMGTRCLTRPRPLPELTPRGLMSYATMRLSSHADKYPSCAMKVTGHSKRIWFFGWGLTCECLATKKVFRMRKLYLYLAPPPQIEIQLKKYLAKKVPERTLIILRPKLKKLYLIHFSTDWLETLYIALHVLYLGAAHVWEPNIQFLNFGFWGWWPNMTRNSDCHISSIPQ